MRAWPLVAAFGSLVLPLSDASAWWDEGHMQVAAVAYYRLTPEARAKADALIQLNPHYESWTAGWPSGHVAEYAFVRAAIWADDIKSSGLGYTDVGDKPTTADAGRNIGYQDFLMHKYWHYTDIGFSTDGTTVEPPDPVNALTQIKALTAGLSTASGLPDSVRSYDLVWLIHVVGDVHQPLHATARFSQKYPHGDQGGNKEAVIPATGETIDLHGYWDGLLGSYSTPQIAIMDALVRPETKLPDPDPALAGVADPADWLEESKKLVEDFVYAEPVRSGARPYMLDRQYETNAKKIGRQQISLAGARLANLINEPLK
ncbi:MAG: S1/P1 nuclease [Inquilinus sp.]|uniref:S1/P1 nuclease n=1 Tax=Inquilinus sp. TaxID=1932117 RepID=UPI003F3B4DBF